jgi:hypothetical protein
MGSGILITRAIEKYGIENFHKEILHIFDNEDEMNAKEKELVVISEDTYNLCPGGKGGFGYINRLGLGMSPEKAKYMYERGIDARKAGFQKWKNSSDGKEFYKKQSAKRTASLRKKFPNGTFKNKTHSEESKKRIGTANSGKTPWNKGKPRTEAEKEKIRQSVLRKINGA